MKEISCLMVMPLQTPKSTTLEVSMKAFNKAVSIGADYELNATAKKIGKNIYAIYADNGILAGLTANRKVNNEIISGIFYVVAINENIHPISLTSKQMVKYLVRFYEPEYYSDRDTLSNWSDCMLKLIDSMNLQ